VRCIDCNDFTHDAVPVVAKDYVVDGTIEQPHVTSSFVLIYEGTCALHPDSVVHSNTECPDGRTD
jgi:hypothetical protein